MILQQLRSDDGMQSESEVSTTNDSFSSPLTNTFLMTKQLPNIGHNTIGILFNFIFVKYIRESVFN